MYFVVLFERNKPHTSENASCGFYSERFENILSFLRTVDFDTHEAVICQDEMEIDTEMSN